MTPVKRTAAAKKKPTFVWTGGPHTVKVELAGSFNNWTPIAVPRRKGKFQVSVALAPGEYRYKFIVDGDWQHDPNAEHSVPNAFGTLDSLIRV